MRIRKPIERWFAVEGDPDDAEILIRHLSPGDIQDNLDAAMKQSYVYDGPDDKPPTMSYGTDFKIDRELTTKKSVVDWKNILSPDGNPMPCNDETKIMAMREIDGFYQFVSECRNRLADDIRTEADEQQKN